jgi:transmembrane sensor
MNSHPTHSPAAEEQAALWAAKLDGSELDAADHAALDAWLAEHASHRDLLSRYCQFSADLEGQLPALVASGAVTMPVTKARRAPRFAWFAGLAFAAAAAVAVVVWQGQPRLESRNVATAVAQRQSLTLADGTKVQLNAQTVLRVEMKRNERHVLLASGEAFFTVSKDPQRPFIVDTPAGSVRVTGTMFNVRSEAATQLEVTVAEGSVQVRTSETGKAASGPVPLTAGDRLTAGPEGPTVQALSPSAIEDALAWREGRIVFNGVPLSEAAERFARYHGRGVKVIGKAAAERVSGRYPLDDFDGFMASIESFLPIQVRSESSGATIITPRSGG